MSNDLGIDLDKNFYKIIPPEIIKRLAECQRPGKYKASMVIIVTDEIIEKLQTGRAADIELHRAPIGYMVFVPEKLIHDFYDKEPKNE